MAKKKQGIGLLGTAIFIGAMIQERREEESRRQCERNKIQQEREKEERRRVRELKKIQREEEKINQYVARAKLVCQKYNIDPICCFEIVEQALETGVTVAKIRTVLIEGRENYWANRAIEIKEEKYTDALNKFIDNVIGQRICSFWEEEFRAAIIKERPEINEFDNSSVLLHYLERTKNLAKIYDWGMEQKQNKKVLGRLFDNFLHDLIEEEPKIDEIEKSKVFLQYVSTSNEMRKKEKYMAELHDWGMEQKQNKKVLGRLFDNFLHDLIEEEPKIDEIEESKVFLQYFTKSNEIRKDIDDRLNMHLRQKII
jgi:hypothetical protein